MNSKTACRGARVSGGDLCEAEAPTEPEGETKSFCPFIDISNQMYYNINRSKTCGIGKRALQSLPDTILVLLLFLLDIF